MYQNTPVGRPKYYLHIQFTPVAIYLKPVDICQALLQKIILTIDETEAIRLADRIFNIRKRLFIY